MVEADAIADELYGLWPGEFTSARDARVTEARKGGDRQLAATIAKLRKPTTAAWLANLLVRQRRSELDQLLQVGDALRQAQRELAGDELRRLSRQRHAVIHALATEARRLAGELGHPVNDPSARELEDTLEAALANPGAARALLTGRLTTGVHYAGLVPLEQENQEDLTGTPSPAKHNPEPGRSPAAAKSDSERRHDEQVAAATQAVAEARHDVSGAEAAVAESDSAMAEATEQRRQLRHEREDLEARLAAARAAEQGADERLAAAEQARRDATERLTAARKGLEQAQSELDGIRRYGDRSSRLA